MIGQRKLPVRQHPSADGNVLAGSDCRQCWDASLLMKILSAMHTTDRAAALEYGQAVLGLLREAKERKAW